MAGWQAICAVCVADDAIYLVEDNGNVNVYCTMGKHELWLDKSASAPEWKERADRAVGGPDRRPSIGQCGC